MSKSFTWAMCCHLLLLLFVSVSWASSLTWNMMGEFAIQVLNGSSLENHANLTELCIDGSKFRPRFARRMSSEHPNHAYQYMLCHCPIIERLSIKECKVSNPTPSGMQSRLLPQALLIKMVRNHPSLHWLRSDLSAENVDMLQQEHPDIAFVSEYVGLYLVPFSARSSRHNYKSLSMFVPAALPS